MQREESIIVLEENGKYIGIHIENGLYEIDNDGNTGKKLTKLKRNPILRCRDLTILFDIRGRHIIIDTEDYNIVKDYVWRIGCKGYVISQRQSKTIYMHRIITNVADGILVKHLNNKHNDNRKCNLLQESKSMCSKNRGILSNNTSGCTGVYRMGNKYKARIWKDGLEISLGTSYHFGEARRLREMAEELYEAKQGLNNQ